MMIETSCAFKFDFGSFRIHWTIGRHRSLELGSVRHFHSCWFDDPKVQLVQEQIFLERENSKLGM